MTIIKGHADRIKVRQEQYRREVADLAEFGSNETKALTEAFGRVVSDLVKLQDEDEGWLVWSRMGVQESVKGVDLEGVKKVTKYIEQNTKTMGGLLGRGLRLKNNHVFGRGYEFKMKDGEKIAPRFKRVIEREDNWAELFSPTALKELNRILFTSGNLFIMYNEKSRTFQRLAIDINIDNAITDRNNKSRIQYILRSYQEAAELNGEAVTSFEWVPTFAHKEHLDRNKENLPKTIRMGPSDDTPVPVSQDSVIIEKRINKDNGDTWGIPDAFGAAPWAVMYSRYLRDGAKLHSALATIAFLVKAKSQEAAAKAGAMVQQGRVGQVAITGPESELSQMPRSGAVNLYEGRPIQAQVASNLDVSVTGLAADPGLGGSYASENALSQPEQLAALGRQEDFTDLFRQIFTAIGVPEMTINFSRLDVDPIHRIIQALTLAREKGGITREEYRDRVAELLDIQQAGVALPDPDVWVDAYKNVHQDAPASDDGDGSAIPGQGRSGAVGPMDDDGNSMANDDASSSEA